jgi:hypothetical protein
MLSSMECMEDCFTTVNDNMTYIPQRVCSTVNTLKIIFVEVVMACNLVDCYQSLEGKFCPLYTSILMTETENTSKASTRRPTSEDNLHSHRPQNLKSRMVNFLPVCHFGYLQLKLYCHNINYTM